MARILMVLALMVIAAGTAVAQEEPAAQGEPAVQGEPAAQGEPAGPAGGEPVGIPCDPVESVQHHLHAHLSIYAGGEGQQLPHGIGIGEPWEIVENVRGPYVTRGSCYSWLHTKNTEGVVHVGAPLVRTFTLGEFFAVWGQPLSAVQVGTVEGEVFAYVDGERVEGDPAAIPLADRQVIQLNVGQDAPPPQGFTFPARCC